MKHVKKQDNMTHGQDRKLSIEADLNSLRINLVKDITEKMIMRLNVEFRQRKRNYEKG